MLPQAPLRLGLTEIKGVSVPAREVGGDFFNYFALDDGHIALLVGDVSGKGVGAALLMANIQASLRTRLALGQDLAAIARRDRRRHRSEHAGPGLRDAVRRHPRSGDARLRYVNAGHNPQYVLRNARRLERMESHGPAGRACSRAAATPKRASSSRAGDLLFFYTDGCVEAENGQGEMFGAERLEALLTAGGPMSPRMCSRAWSRRSRRSAARASRSTTRR